MDEEYGDNENQNRFLNRFSQTQKKRASAMSLQRSNHSFQRESSINNRHSFVQVMSLEGSEKNENFYEKLLFEERRRSLVRNSNNIKSSYFNRKESEEEEEPRQTQRCSGSNKIIRHECKCMTYCLQTFCTCFYENQQICLQGHCCENCIRNKYQKFRNEQKLQGCLCQNSQCKNMYCKCFKIGKKCDPRICSCSECKNILECYDIKQHQHIQKYMKYSERVRRLVDEKGYAKIQEVVCSCRKSNCLKEYCGCYYYGVGCGPRCKCKGCRNVIDEGDDIQEILQKRQRFGRIQSESEREDTENNSNIDKYFVQQSFDGKQLPESMQFDHPNIGKH